MTMEPTTYEFDVTGPLEVSVRVPSGTIRVDATKGAEQAAVSITGARNEDDLRVEMLPAGSDGQRLVIESRRRGSFGFRGWGQDIRIQVSVPTETGIDVESGSADLEITGEAGTVALRSGSGDLSCGTVASAVVKTASGDVRAERIEGDLTVHGASGDARIGGIGGRLIFRSASGDLEVDNLAGDATATVVSGDVRFGSVSAGTLEVRSVSGDVWIGVVPDTDVWLELSSTSGDVASDLGSADGGADHASLEIRAVSVSGDIRVTSAATHKR
jgi:hypothetical protein